MDDAFGVRGFQRAAHLLDDVGRFRGLKLFLAPEQAPQVLALDVLHGDELDAIGLAEVENANHIVVGDLARENQFLLEALQDFGIRGQVAANYLQRNLAVQFAVMRLVNRAHSALPKHFE